MSKPSYVTYVDRPARRLRRREPSGRDLRRPRRLPGPAQQGVRRPRPLAPPDARLRRRRSPCATRRRPRSTSSTSRPRCPTGQEAFLNAASPGVIALFFRNDHYATREEYVYAIAEAMRVEYEAVTDAGILVQIDCPDLAMGRHIQFADKDLDDFRKEAQLNIEALNHATRNIDPEHAQDARLLGQLRGPAPLRRAASRTSSTSSSRRARTRSPSRPPTRATPTSGRSSRTSSCPTARC